MKAAALVDRLGDLLNPIAVKELRQAVKSRIVVSALMLFLLLQISILLLSLSFRESHAEGPINLHIGRDIFQVLQGVLLGACMLLVPAYAGVRLATERSDTNVDLLFISTLRPRAIIAGKLQAAVVLILLIFSACAPFMTFTYLLRGIDIPSIVLILVLDFLTVLLGAQTTIFLGAVPANIGLKLFLGLVGLYLLGMLFAVTVEFSWKFLATGLGSRLDSAEFWLVAGAAAIYIVAVIGLLFTWSVATVSPPSANRALPVRLYLLGFWLATGGMAMLLACYFAFPIPLFLWMDAVTVLLCALFLVSINEREQWGLRVRRTIPRRLWLRVPLFLLYSGSAGGVLFLVLLLALTIALPSFALEQWPFLFFPSSSGFVLEASRRNTLVMALMALYTFDYCMTALWLRSVLLSKWVKAGHTWALVLILGALGTSLPWPLLFLFDNEALRLDQIDPWWRISDPVSTIFTCMEPNSVVFRGQCLLFLSALAWILLLGCLPWMGRQMGRFRPPEKEHNPAKTR